MNCKNPDRAHPSGGAYKIIFLHHSTGQIIWQGEPKGIDKIKNIFSEVNAVPDWFEKYNEAKRTNYFIREQNFPKGNPYTWDNYPYDYYNIWVKNAGNSPFMEEPTLEMLTREYDLIIFKHCYPVGLIEDDTGDPDINSSDKRIENYKMQYEALREKFHQFPEKLFLLWTGAANVKSQTNPEKAERTKMFFEWVKNEWDIEGDNIYLWDFYELETEGGLYLTDNNARNPNDSHPSAAFGAKVAPLFCQRIVDIIETRGQKTTLTGLPK